MARGQPLLSHLLPNLVRQAALPARQVLKQSLFRYCLSNNLGVPMSIHPSADIASSAQVPDSAHVWHLAQLRENVVLGEFVVVGRGAYIGPGVRVGANTKIQNHALVYEPAELGEGVFIGPGVILTNDRHPRAVDPSGVQKSAADWDMVGVRVEDGASIGAGAICVAPVSIGNWAIVAAGSIVTRDVPPFALVAGTPARQIGWVGRAGQRLVPCVPDETKLMCPKTGEAYRLSSLGLQMVEELP